MPPFGGKTTLGGKLRDIGYEVFDTDYFGFKNKSLPKNLLHIDYSVFDMCFTNRPNIKGINFGFFPCEAIVERRLHLESLLNPINYSKCISRAKYINKNRMLQYKKQYGFDIYEFYTEPVVFDDCSVLFDNAYKI